MDYKTKDFVGAIATYLAIAAVIVLCLIPIFQIASSDGKVEFCYIQTTSTEVVPKTYYKLYGFRPWRMDNTMGIFESFEQAVDAAELADCALGK